ncbi:MAG: TetR/AcrR family transcriptional regulator [Streptococcaceae bacterium]|jgi:AcrR family transcriptional regulator|nr:TetR/AcrR family transcriptional regulator [Streptococcaceae bacterium]
MTKKQDLRVTRTQKLITQAFFALLRKKKFEKISIQEIADSAMINRATFYAHYADKQDLYDSLIDGFLTDFTGVLDEGEPIVGVNVKIRDIERLLTRFYSFVYQNPEIAQMIIDKAQDGDLQARFLDVLSERYTELFAKLEVTENAVKVPNDFVLAYITSILVGTLKWWVTGDSALTAAEFAHLVIKLISNGHLTVLGVNIDREI